MKSATKSRQSGEKSEMDAVKMLKEDHKRVKELFDQFEEAQETKEKEQIAAEAMRELKTHTLLEEEIFYPAVWKKIKEEELMYEAKEEHHVVDLLMEEIQQLDADDPVFSAKFIVLAENVRHHIKEEEGEMLPQAQKAGLDLEALGAEMRVRKDALASEAMSATEETPTETKGD